MEDYYEEDFEGEESPKKYDEEEFAGTESGKESDRDVKIEIFPTLVEPETCDSDVRTQKDSNPVHHGANNASARTKYDYINNKIQEAAIKFMDRLSTEHQSNRQITHSADNLKNSEFIDDSNYNMNMNDTGMYSMEFDNDDNVDNFNDDESNNDIDGQYQQDINDNNASNDNGASPTSLYSLPSDHLSPNDHNYNNNDDKKSPSNMRKQLEIALMRLSSVTKEKEILEASIAESQEYTKINNMKGIVTEQKKIINGLKNEMKGLDRIRQSQANQISEYEREKKNNTDFGDSSDEKQIHVLLERVRRLNLNAQQAKISEREKTSILREKNSQIKKLRAYIVQIVRSKRNENDCADFDSNNAIKNNGPHSMIDDETSQTSSYEEDFYRNFINPGEHNNDLISINENYGHDHHANNNNSNTETSLRRTVNQLQKSITVQKSSYTREINHLKEDLLKSRDEVTRFEEELDARERHARAQILIVKQLRQTCDELEAGNERLMLASEVYSQTMPEPAHRNANDRGQEKENNSNANSVINIEKNIGIEYRIKGDKGDNYINKPTAPKMPHQRGNRGNAKHNFRSGGNGKLRYVERKS